MIKDGKGAPEAEKKTIAPAPNAPATGKMDSKVVDDDRQRLRVPFLQARRRHSMAEVRKNYGDKIKVVWRDLPLPMHPDAPLAAEAAMEAYKEKGSKAFWEIHDKLFANQQDLKRETLDKYAKELGLDDGKFKNALDNRTNKPLVEADAKAAKRAGHLPGTPRRSSSMAITSAARSLSRSSRS